MTDSDVFSTCLAVFEGSVVCAAAEVVGVGCVDVAGAGEACGDVVVGVVLVVVGVFDGVAGADWAGEA